MLGQGGRDEIRRVSGPQAGAEPQRGAAAFRLLPQLTQFGEEFLAQRRQQDGEAGLS